ncbi:hypothetical protein MAPG_05698 [Magnaporthiopsis poae ATCC 64411]|uniref:Aminoglycoside phosphotransferase domain-containing protein n=1 Tax=Magnaporthiopsis poae (strain ATCC 64411 / 73-15) TaxID=644358 RepID=A0A0C4E032_MAGP6|nr:hypothetical protein MAPG_05698 [Magnaporthiopsis poae ATCC 64411]
MATETTARDSIRETSDTAWVIGRKICLSPQSSPPPTGAFWSDGAGSYYAITDAHPAPVESRPLPPTSLFQKVYDAGDCSAVWTIGEAYCKVHILDRRIPRAIREHVTLDRVKKRHPSFIIPEVHHYAEFDGRSYLFASKVHVDTLGQAWAKMEEDTKRNCVLRVVSIIKELAAWQSDEISGADGEYMSDLFLTPLGTEKDCSPQNLLRNCTELGMNVSKFLFYHCDLGPGNIIVDTAGAIVGIIDWETAGFVPREWIRTKFCISSGLDLPADDMKERMDWRGRVQKELGREGFPEIAERWFPWWSRD